MKLLVTVLSFATRFEWLRCNNARPFFVAHYPTASDPSDTAIRKAPG
jgi:hypothetical protein